MTICRGIVKDNVLLIEKGAQLPEGTEVEGRLLERPLTRQEAFTRVRTHRITRLCGDGRDHCGGKQGRKEHPETWLTP